MCSKVAIFSTIEVFQLCCCVPIQAFSRVAVWKCSYFKLLPVPLAVLLYSVMAIFSCFALPSCVAV